ncbi:hypothetical protein LC653_21695 [Nostoc sp. CHAB 5784]|uniref:hypothetical protein n=1 Tax=Nostoc mirabile TaxID=2907820 RepID=UPI001E468B73|nr:hypothetical protein [Nostoc mirabile]MCC5666458.1 hypothetical protein [Nostoc mirabile CHAB5784]
MFYKSLIIIPDYTITPPNYELRSLLLAAGEYYELRSLLLAAGEYYELRITNYELRII